MKDEITLYHRGGRDLKVNSDGPFGSFLFFGDSKGACGLDDFDRVLYAIEIDESEIVRAADLYSVYDADALKDQIIKTRTVIGTVMRMINVDKDDAIDFLREKKTVWQDLENVEDLAEIDWTLQRLTAEAARLQGYRAVRVNDEQGASVMIDMLGRESELRIVD